MMLNDRNSLKYVQLKTNAGDVLRFWVEPNNLYKEVYRSKKFSTLNHTYNITIEGMPETRYYSQLIEIERVEKKPIVKKY